MPGAFILSELARSDLDHIWRYIARDNPSAADRVEDDMLDAFGKLAENPCMGHRRADLTDKPVRFWPVYSYQIIYRPDAVPLEIVRILSGYQDIVERL